MLGFLNTVEFLPLLKSNFYNIPLHPQYIGIAIYNRRGRFKPRKKRR